MVGGGWFPGDYLGLNPTTVMVVLLFGLWLLLGCDNCRVTDTKKLNTSLVLKIFDQFGANMCNKSFSESISQSIFFVEKARMKRYGSLL